jgi:hypothetical protein
MAVDPNMTDLDLRYADAELTKRIIDLKAAGPSDELRAAKTEHRELRAYWREVRQWVLAVNGAPDAVAQPDAVDVTVNPKGA